jgi:hypothetical protein
LPKILRQSSARAGSFASGSGGSKFIHYWLWVLRAWITHVSFGLGNDPHEDNNLIHSELTDGWLMVSNFKLIGEYERSVKEYPNIQ